MRQTAEKAVPLAKSTVKPQRKWALAQKHRETLGKKRRSHPAQSRVYYHSEVRTPIATAMFGENVETTFFRIDVKEKLDPGGRCRQGPGRIFGTTPDSLNPTRTLKL